MISIIYDVIIQPLVVIYDLVFSLIYGIVEAPVPAITLLSFIITPAAIPLYMKADSPELESRKKVRVLRESIPVLLQIPFFLAAYNYISFLSYFDGMRFGPISNLLAPDGLLNINGISINVLPLLMTLINVIAVLLLLKDEALIRKILSCILAGIFLVFLYNSPSMLVIYWLMNNFFFLFRTIFFRYNKLSKTVISNICSLFLMAAGIYSLMVLPVDAPIDSVVAAALIVLSYVLILKNFIMSYISSHPEKMDKIKERMDNYFSVSSDDRYQLIGLFVVEICLVLFMGLYIPSTVLSSSAADFMNKATGKFSYSLIIFPVCFYSGLLLLWLTVFVFSKKHKNIRKAVSILWMLLGMGLVNQFLFVPKVGKLYTNLSFEKEIYVTPGKTLVNILLVVLVAGLFVFLYNKKPAFMNVVAVFISAVILVLGIMNIGRTIRTVNDKSSHSAEAEQPLKLSKSGKNVVVFMLDRAIGEYLPYIFDEKPEYKESFRGFVYYPNTVAFGVKTNYGAPALFGGYEYTPEEINKREDKLLVDKHNEALKLMPVIFSENGYDTVVCDPPLAGYNDVPDLSIYDDYPDIKTYKLTGKYSSNVRVEYTGDSLAIQKHNFVIYSLFRTVPLFLKTAVYDEANYLAMPTYEKTYTQKFIDSYSVLDVLPEITEAKDDSSDNFLMIQNDTPHQPDALNAPEYKLNGTGVDYEAVPSEIVSGDKTMLINRPWSWDHYSTNVAVYREVAEWLDYLKEEGVYDNTRIIIVADHGYNLAQFDYLKTPDGLDIERVDPLLMVKDFNSNDDFSTSMEFMSNADTPTLAMKDIIDNPLNPFTGNPVNDDMKRAGPLKLMISDRIEMDSKTVNKFDMSYSTWWTVHDNIYDMNNWEKGESQ